MDDKEKKKRAEQAKKNLIMFLQATIDDLRDDEIEEFGECVVHFGSKEIDPTDPDHNNRRWKQFEPTGDRRIEIRYKITNNKKGE